MKNLFILCIALLAMSCQQKPADMVGKNTKISGKITNAQSDTVVISQGSVMHKIGLDSTGQFSKEISNLSEGVYTFGAGRESSSMYIMPGKDLNITLDTKQFDETITYEGEAAAASNYLAKKYLQEEQNPVNFKEVYGADEATFKAKVESMGKEKLDFLAGNSALSPAFVALEKKAIDYDRISMLMRYKSGHAHFTGNSDFEVSPDFGDPLSGIDMDNEKEFVNIQSYKDIVLSSFLMGEMKDNIAKLSSIKSPSIKKEVVKNMTYYMTPGSPDLDVIYDGLHSNMDDEESKAKLTESYELYKGLAKGKPSPQFEYIDRNGKMVSMEEMKGKNVYIDVWATWCGPCKAEIPSLKALEKEYHGKNVEFVSISIDKMKDKDKWIKMVEEKELKGVQLFSDKDWSSDFVKDYGIQGIPRFILVDAQGNIVSADAPRPSSDSEIKGLFTDLGI